MKSILFSCLPQILGTKIKGKFLKRLQSFLLRNKLFLRHSNIHPQVSTIQHIHRHFLGKEMKLFKHLFPFILTMQTCRKFQERTSFKTLIKNVITTLRKEASKNK